MRRYFQFVFLMLFFHSLSLQGQEVILEGYVFEGDNRGYLNEVQIVLTNMTTNEPVADLMSNKEGFFSCKLPINGEFELHATKNIFNEHKELISTKNKSAGEKLFASIKLIRKPGYLFELTMAEKRINDLPALSVTGAWVEVYNHTTGEQEVNIKNFPDPIFSHTLEQGNHYTFLFRKEAYINKRIEAFVNVEGCILCIDGVSDLQPGVSDNLTEGFQMGTLLANLELEPIKLNEGFKIENIYYDYDKWSIRKDAAHELKKVVTFLKRNPTLNVELGSHTDSRGKDDYNLRLSQKRAQSAVNYIMRRGNIVESRITAKGYGETELVNACANDVKCSEKEHQENRRTEIKITSIAKEDPFENMTLTDIIEQERQEALLQQIMESEEVIEVKSEDDLPPEIKKEIEKSKKKKRKKRKNG